MQPMPKHEVARIVRDSRICGGEPTVAGTRVPVRSVVIQWQKYRNYERIMRAFPRLDVEAIETALSFYEANRYEIDRSIEANERAAYTAD